MKKVLFFILVSALLAFSMASCKVEPKQDEALEDEAVEDAATEDEVAEEKKTQDKYNIIYTPSDEISTVSPEELRVFWDKDTDRYGYETENGEIIIPAIFRNSTVFFEGLAAVCREWDGPLEYIDASGNTVLTVEGIDGSSAIDYYGFQPPCIFNDGVAVIYEGGFCIDKNGNRLNIENPEGMYKCGLIAVRDPETNLIGYADIDGNIVIPYKYFRARDFEPQGVALVFSEEIAINPHGLESNLRGYINTKGEEIIPLEYYDGPDCGASYIHPIHREVDGMIELYKDGYYYFAYDGTLVKEVPGGKPAETKEIVEETEAETVDGIPKELYDTYGESVINPEGNDYSYIRINFDESREISGYYEIEEGEIIDSNGKVYSEIEDESLLEKPGSRYPDIPAPEGVDSIYDSPYSSNLLKFRQDNRYGYLNIDGEIVIDAQFYEASNFSEGLAAVCREYGGCLEYINESGETVLMLEDADGYSNIFTMFPGEPNCDFSEGLAMINGGDFYVDKEGNRIVIENACGMYKNGLVLVYDPETYLEGYSDINGNIVIPCKYVWARDFLPCGAALVFDQEFYEPVIDAYPGAEMRYCGYVNTNGEEIIPLEFYCHYNSGASALYPMPHEKDGIIEVFKEGYSYYYRYDGTLLGKKPHMKKIAYGDEWYNINLAEYWEWVNAGMPVG